MLRKALFPAIVALALAFSSCASGPAPAPNWVLSAPPADATNTYFVGSASDASGDVSKATNDAAANLVASIMQYIGVKVTVDSSATARATLDSYQADIRSTVTARSDNRLSGFQVKENYVQRNPKEARVTVYVLAAYATVDLEKEKRRIAALFQEQVDAVAKPEAEGRAFADSGRAYDAFRKFVEAAVAASGADIDNAEIKLERNLNAARSALAKVAFDATAAAGMKALIGQPFERPFAIRLVQGEGASAPGVPGAALLVSYQRKSGTRLVSRTETVLTGPNGLLSFSPPPPDFVGKAKLTVRLDVQPSLDLLDKLPPKYEAFRVALADELKGKYVEVGYEVTSNARNVPTAVAIADFDESGAVLPGAQTQAGVVESLVRERFSARPVAADPQALAALDEAAALAAARAAKLDRIVFGAARVTGVRKDGGSYIADAQASVRALDVASAALVYSAEKAASGVGPDAESARKAALRELGASALGKDLLASLP